MMTHSPRFVRVVVRDYYKLFYYTAYIELSAEQITLESSLKLSIQATGNECMDMWELCGLLQ